MNNNNKKPFNLSSKNKSEPETRVFARLISRGQIERVAGGKVLSCTWSELNYDVTADCKYE